jgi:DNA polymerase III alpha subunit
MCSLISREGDTDKLHSYIREAVKMGIPVMSPDVNVSDFGWTLTDQGIRFGLGSVTGVAEKAYTALQSGRPFTSLDDFLRRADKKVLNLGVLKALVQCGALDSVEPNREELFENLEDITERVVELRDLKTGGQTTLYDKKFAMRPGRPKLGCRQSWEREVLGIALTVRRVRLVCSRLPSVYELDYLGEVIRTSVGSQPVDVVLSELTTLRDVGSIALTPETVVKIVSLSFIDIEEDE